jgi:hypothetical protein
MTCKQDKKTAHWSTHGAYIERAGKRWRQEEHKLREISREEKLWPQEAAIKAKKARTVKETKEWARTQHNEWQQTELEHVNERERAWKDYMEVLVAAITIQEENSTQSILDKVKACRK